MLVCILLSLLVMTSPSYPWALALLGFLAVAGESFIPVLPLGPLVAVNVLVLSVWDGFLVSYLGALVGSSAGYWFARTLGRGWVMQKFPAKYRARVDEFAAETSFTGLLLTWLVPGLNCVVSCASGMGGVRFPRFFVTCALGLLPWVALYALLAHDLARAGTYGVSFTAVAVLLGAVYLAGRWYRR
jgi:uncharacterized membrane protein YdjX (TVP38/TMEM64 family)